VSDGRSRWKVHFAPSAISPVINPWKETTRLTSLRVPGWPNCAKTQALHCINAPIQGSRNKHKGVASIGLLDNFIDQASQPGGRGMTMRGWRFVGLYVYYVLLSALAVLFAAAFATAPYWIWPT
jgi:hypothetical protein